MKVNIYETVEVSDDDRKLIAAHLGQKTATRDDLKAFLWEHGRDWRQVLTPAVDSQASVAETEAEVQASVDASVGPDPDEEDLFGSVDDEEDLI